MPHPGSSRFALTKPAFVKWAATGKFSAVDLLNTIADKALRAAACLEINSLPSFPCPGT